MLNPLPKGQRTLAGCLLLALLMTAGGAHAVTFSVTSTDDTVDVAPGDGLCADASGNCSLRAAVQEANAQPGADNIDLAAGTYTLTLAGNNEQAAATGDLDLTGPVTITGAGANRTFINANGLDRIFEMVNAGNITLVGMTLENGVAGRNNLSYGGVDYVGGAIFHAGTPSVLTLDGIVIRNCSARSGGAIHNVYSTLVVRNSTLHDNSATAGSGGAINEGLGGYTRLYNTTLSGNRAVLSGGALYGANNPPVLNNTTITNNVADSDNNGTGNGGGLATGYSISLGNSILAGNIDLGGEAPDCSGNMTSAGYILVGNNKGCTVSSATGNRVGTASWPIAAGLQPLADNGGTTPTHALLNGPAVDGGHPGTPGMGGGTCEAFDQRGVDRTIRYECDIGAFEHDADGEQVFTVNSTLDQVDVNIGDGRCETAPMNEVCTLRAAIQESNAQIGPNSIELPAGTYTITRPGADDVAAVGDLDITDTLLLNGANAATTILDGNNLDRVIDIRSGQSTLNAITIRNGNASGAGGTMSGYGGGIMQLSGAATLNDSVITDNRAINCGGFFTYNYNFTFSGLIFNRVRVQNNSATGFGGGGCNFTLGSFEMYDSTITLNNANQGGGLFNSFRSYTTISGSTINANTANFGGGIFTQWGQGIITLINSTISGNSSQFSGGGAYVNTGDTLNLRNTTFTDNVITGASGTGGGIYSSGIVNLRNSLLANNYATSQTAHECSGTLTSEGYNLVADTDGCTFVGSVGDLAGSTENPLDARLGPLADNGGHSFSHALLPDSPALNAGNPLAPGSGGAACEPNDQRGADRIVNASCDIGAVETRLADLAISITDSADPLLPGSEVTYTLNVENLGPDTADEIQLFNTLPEGATLIAVAGGDWSCDDQQPVLACTLSELHNASVSELEITLSLPETSGSHHNDAYVSSATLDLNSVNNTASETTLTNLAPRVYTLGQVDYTAGGQPVLIAPKIKVSDADGNQLTGANIRIDTAYHGEQDVLTFTDTSTIVGSWDAASGTLTLSGTDSLEAYERALRSVFYVNVGTTPTAAVRSYSVSISDGFFSHSETNGAIDVQLPLIPPPVETAPAPTPEPISAPAPVPTPVTPPGTQAFTAPPVAGTTAPNPSATPATPPQQPAVTPEKGADKEGSSDQAEQADKSEQQETREAEPASEESAADADSREQEQSAPGPLTLASLSTASASMTGRTVSTTPAAFASAAEDDAVYHAGKVALPDDHHLWQQLDEMKTQMQASINERPLHEAILVGTAQGATLFAFAGTVNWVLKGSHLLAGLLSSLPLWTQFDPLAVLALTRRERRRRREERINLAREDDNEYAKLNVILNRRRQARG